MRDDYLSVLRREFSAEEGSFLLELRGNVWDKAAFTRLTEAMLECCRAYDRTQPPTLFGHVYDTETVPRWLAEGFWYVDTFVRGHTSHPAWDDKKRREPDYYEAAYERLFDLADWFFTGQCPSLDPNRTFTPM